MTMFFCTWPGGSVNESLVCVTIQMKAIGAGGILRGTLTKLYRVVVITLESLDENLVCDHFNESYWPVLSGRTINFLNMLKTNCDNFST